MTVQNLLVSDSLADDASVVVAPPQFFHQEVFNVLLQPVVMNSKQAIADPLQMLIRSFFILNLI